jgi:hypothetical protein
MMGEAKVRSPVIVSPKISRDHPSRRCAINGITPDSGARTIVELENATPPLIPSSSPPHNGNRCSNV